MSKARIRCQVMPGLFESEYYVLVNGSSAYYIHRTNVEVSAEPTAEHPVSGIVYGYKVQELGNKVLVQLPGEAALGGVRTWVESADVVAA